MQIKKTIHLRREYNSWLGARYRCSSEKHPAWEHYGGRGITMCERWANDFWAFYEDMGPRPEGKELDRINNDGNYEPGNCRWVTSLENLNNRGPRTQRKRITYNGIRATVDVWSAMTGIPQSELELRIARGWSSQHIVGAKMPCKWVCFDNISYDVRELSKQFNKSEGTIISQWKKGWSFDQISGETKAVHTRINKKEAVHFLTVKGETKSVAEWVNLRGGSTQEVRRRIKEGATHAQAVGLEPYTPYQLAWFKRQLEAIPGVVIY